MRLRRAAFVLQMTESRPRLRAPPGAVQPSARQRPRHAGGRRKAEGQLLDRADREIGEDLCLQRIAIPAHGLDGIDRELRLDTEISHPLPEGRRKSFAISNYGAPPLLRGLRVWKAAELP